MFDKLYDEMKAHAVTEYPKEACGLVVDGKYVPTKNVAEDPLTWFMVPPRAMAAARKKGGAQAIFHSHPDGPNYASYEDMVGQSDTALPWIILETNGRVCSEPFILGGAPEDLYMRPFRHGTTDCYGAVRDWYRVHRDLLLPDFPRAWGWWREGGNLYEANFGPVGFRRIQQDEVQPGDACLISIRSPVPNHAGVYLGRGLFYHHLTARLPYDPHRLAANTPLGSWVRHVTHWLRYEGC